MVGIGTEELIVYPLLRNTGHTKLVTSRDERNLHTLYTKIQYRVYKWLVWAQIEELIVYPLLQNILLDIQNSLHVVMNAIYIQNLYCVSPQKFGYIQMSKITNLALASC
jgi:hypothetical protein